LPDFFTVNEDTQITVFADSVSGTVKLINATLNGKPLPVDANAKTTFQAIAGRLILNMAFVGSDPDEVFGIKEDCGGGNSQLLANWRLQPSAAGDPGAPTKAFTITAQPKVQNANV